MPRTIDALIQQTKPDGTFSFREKAPYYVTDFGVMPKMDKARKLIELKLLDFDLFLLLLQKVKRHIRDIDTHIEQAVDGEYVVKFNMVKLLGLPNIDPVAELQELAALVQTWKAFMTEYAPRIPLIQVFNERKDGRVVGGINCLYRDGADRHTKDAAWNQKMCETIAASAVLTHFMNHWGKALQKLGPYSWFSFRSSHLFCGLEDPVHAAIRRQLKHKK